MISFPVHWRVLFSLPLALEGGGKVAEHGQPCILAINSGVNSRSLRGAGTGSRDSPVMYLN